MAPSTWLLPEATRTEKLEAAKAIQDVLLAMVRIGSQVTQFARVFVLINPSKRPRRGIDMEEKKKENHNEGERARRQPPLHNRVGIALMHSNKLAFNSITRLSQAVGCSRSTIWRMLHGRTQPSYALVEKVTQVIADDLGIPLTPADLFSTSGKYRVASGCCTFGCEGCFPEEAWDNDGELTPEFQRQQPGDWTLAEADTNDDHQKSEEFIPFEDAELNECADETDDPENVAFFLYK